MSAVPTIVTVFPSTQPAGVECRSWGATELLRADIQRPDTLVDPFLAASTAAILAGPPNVGKSWLMLTLALALACGRDWLGHFPTTPSRVLVVDEESNPGHVQERLQMLAVGGTPIADDTQLRFEIGHGQRVDDPHGYHCYRQWIEAHRPDVVIIDSMIRVHGADENSAGQMADVFASVKGLMREFNTAVVFVDHSRKRSMVDNSPEEMLRGTIEKRAWADSILYIAPADDGTMRVSHTKMRYGARLPDFRIRLNVDDGAARVVYDGEAVDRGAATLTVVHSALLAVREALGPDATDVLSVAAQVGCAEKTARKHLKALVAGGQIAPRNVPSHGGRPRIVFDSASNA